jgi:hypothetical protein
MAPSADRYLMVVSGGADLCGEGCCEGSKDVCSASPQEFAALTNELLVASGIRTFAVGFGKDIGADGAAAGQLDAIAQNGGTGHEEFLDAADGASLGAAFDTIAAMLVSCTYAVGDPAPSADPGNVNVYLDGVVVGYDEGCAQGKGWTWTDDTHTAIELCGEACDELGGGAADDLSARLGCPTVPIG